MCSMELPWEMVPKQQKEAADYITAPLHEDGIYKGIGAFWTDFINKSKKVLNRYKMQKVRNERKNEILRVKCKGNERKIKMVRLAKETQKLLYDYRLALYLNEC